MDPLDLIIGTRSASDFVGRYPEPTLTWRHPLPPDLKGSCRQYFHRLELGMEPEGIDVHGASILVVGRIGDVLKIGRNPHRI